MEKNIVILVSNSQLDIMATQANGYWENSKNARDINEGDIVFIKPNNPELKKYGNNAKVIKGIVSKLECDVQGTGTWPSGHGMTNGCRIELDNMELINYSHVDVLLNDLGQNASGIYYLKLQSYKYFVNSALNRIKVLSHTIILWVSSNNENRHYGR